MIKKMGLLLVLVLILCSFFFLSNSSKPFSLRTGSSLFVENKDDILISPNALFTAGFYAVGKNAYFFAIWFTKPLPDEKLTITWMANRDQPINGKRSKLVLTKNGNLNLKDADQESSVWTTNTREQKGSVQLKLLETGNLVLEAFDGRIIWQSFDSSTHTLLSNQSLTKDTTLVSSRSLTNHSSGYYELYFDNDNVLRLVYNGPTITSVYWPDPSLRAWDAGRSTYNSQRRATLNFSGHFHSTDALDFYTSDYSYDQMEKGKLRRLTLDVDGVARVYTLDEDQRKWLVTWQALSNPCKVHGICGENSTCSFDPKVGKMCSCLPRHTMIDPTDWARGCRPQFNATLCGNGEDRFLHLPRTDFIGFDASYLPNYTFDACRQACLKICNCKGFQYRFSLPDGYYLCYAKFRLFNGLYSPGFNGSMYIKLPKSIPPSSNLETTVQSSGLNCSSQETIQLDRLYEKKPENGSIKFMLYFTFAFGGLEILCFVYFFYKTRETSSKRIMQGYLQAATGFKRFSYAELKKASCNFRNEIGRGGGGVVYKGVLSDNRVAAIKCLKEAIGEAEFKAEVSTIGTLNHMNLIDVWGYCAEGKHRLLVYEYMEHGSLAQNLGTETLDWEKRFGIAVGTAKGLAYLHEECLEWVLHCDVKPQNILLDCNFNPKVADFGLSKLLERSGNDKSLFTRARGTRGYMAPEWVFVNLPITSKVDVYSYGVVMLEMITGTRETDVSPQENNSLATENSVTKPRSPERRLVSLAKEIMQRLMDESGTDSWINEIVDPKLDAIFDMEKMKTLIKVSLQCVDEDRDARPTMSKVVNMLLHRKDDEI